MMFTRGLTSNNRNSLPPSWIFELLSNKSGPKVWVLIIVIVDSL